jgi:SAM-dependent methyltransferase/methyltransferase-like protein
MSDLLAASYDAVPYESKPIELAEPDAMAAIAILHGVTPTPADRCRVLELGCAAGGNLIDLAFTSPKSRFVGVDLAPSQIAIGQLTISEMGLQNISLEVGSIDQIDTQFGEFDYIICHGVYSWVPPHVQDAILRTCAACLTPNGVAYVSYNTLPGWHRRAMLRDMLVFHDDETLTPEERVARARGLADFLFKASSPDDSAHYAVLREEIEHLKSEADHLLFHEQLEPFNQPIYFSEFARRAGTFGLQFLSEARLSSNTLAGDQRLETLLGPGADRLRAEQYRDFVAGRTFRKTLLCRAGIDVKSAPLPSAVPQLFVRSLASPAEPSPEDAARGPGVRAFRAPRGASMTTNNPLVIAMLNALGSVSPTVVSFPELQRMTAEQLRALPDEGAHTLADDEAILSEVLLQCAENQFVAFRSLPSRFVAAAGKRPKASSFARWQSLHTEHVNSLAHWRVQVSGMERFLLPHLDGSNDRQQLLRVIERAFQSGDLAYSGGGPSREQLAEVLDDVLAQLGRSAVLVS